MERLTKTNLVEVDLASEAEEIEDTLEQASEGSLTDTNRDSSTESKKYTYEKTPKIWAVGGGKGGVGKSLISANFALKLSTRGHKVVAIDLDFGGSNLHTCLGVTPPKIGVGDWVTRRSSKLESLLVPTSYPGLALVSGSPDPLKVESLLKKRSIELMESIRQLNVDDVIIDLGAGTQDLTIEFFNSADEGILSILPEPTSVENAYRFIRAAFYKKLLAADISSGIVEVIDAAMDPNNILGIRAPSDLLMIVEQMDQESYQKMIESLKTLKPHIVINQVRNQVDVDVGKAICSVCRRYFGLQVRYSGYLDYDNAVWKAVRARKPVIKEYPRSALAGRLDRLTNTLLGEEKGLFP